jgi:diaminohydroxyphosphoribosylaminopyrimidine deaminase / 5-amino-6-(5-phosphoribosylamino)uracil reductase
MPHPFSLSPPLPSTPCRSHHPPPRRLISCSAVSAVSAGASKPCLDANLLHRAADLADRSAGLTSPHPNFGCVITRGDSDEVAGEGFLYAQGTKCAELQAVQAAGELARGGVAYLNLEPGDCYGDHTAVSALVQVVICLLWDFFFFFLCCFSIMGLSCYCVSVDNRY